MFPPYAFVALTIKKAGLNPVYIGLPDEELFPVYPPILEYPSTEWKEYAT